MKLAIVGSRNFHNYELFIKKMNDVLTAWNISLYYFDEITSGGCKGVDKLAEKLADTYKIPIKVFPAEWYPNGKYDKDAGTNRNTDIVNYADVMIAFVAKDSIGTYDSIRKAQKKGISLAIVNI